MRDIFPGSLLDIAGVFVAVVQERFAEKGLPWRWRPKYERDDSQAATEAAPAPISITSAYAEEDDVRDALPRVVVSVPEATLQPIASGHRAAIRTPDRTEVFTAFDVMPVVIECRGKTAGEASLIADTVRTAVACGRNGVREAFNLHDVSLPAMSEPTKNGDAYAATVRFQVVHQPLWRTTPLRPRVQEIALRVKAGQFAAQEVALYNDFTR